jgi:excisionase family DNA binding protein
MKLTFEQLPSAVEEIRNQLIRIEEKLNAQNSGNTYSSKGSDNRLLNLPEAAKFCGNMPVSTFRRHLRDGNVTGSKPGKHWLFSTEDLNAFVERFKVQSKDELMESSENIIISK